MKLNLILILVVSLSSSIALGQSESPSCQPAVDKVDYNCQDLKAQLDTIKKQRRVTRKGMKDNGNQLKQSAQRLRQQVQKCESSMSTCNSACVMPASIQACNAYEASVAPAKKEADDVDKSGQHFHDTADKIGTSKDNDQAAADPNYQPKQPGVGNSSGNSGDTDPSKPVAGNDEDQGKKDASSASPNDPGFYNLDDKPPVSSAGAGSDNASSSSDSGATTVKADPSQGNSGGINPHQAAQDALASQGSVGDTAQQVADGAAGAIGDQNTTGNSIPDGGGQAADGGAQGTDTASTDADKRTPEQIQQERQEFRQQRRQAIREFAKNAKSGGDIGKASSGGDDKAESGSGSKGSSGGNGGGLPGLGDSKDSSDKTAAKSRTRSRELADADEAEEIDDLEADPEVNDLNAGVREPLALASPTAQQVNGPGQPVVIANPAQAQFQQDQNAALNNLRAQQRIQGAPIVGQVPNAGGAASAQAQFRQPNIDPRYFEKDAEQTDPHFQKKLREMGEFKGNGAQAKGGQQVAMLDPAQNRGRFKKSQVGGAAQSADGAGAAQEQATGEAKQKGQSLASKQPEKDPLAEVRRKEALERQKYQRGKGWFTQARSWFSRRVLGQKPKRRIVTPEQIVNSKRGPASVKPLGMTDKNTFIFSSVCSSYKDLINKNVNSERALCPPAR